MLAKHARRFGLLLAAAVAVTACGRTKLGYMDARDSGKTLPDAGHEGDRPGDSSPARADAVADARLVARDIAPDTSIPDGDRAGPDTTIVPKDAVPDVPVLVPDSAGPDTAITSKDTGPDRGIDQRETAAEARGQDTGGNEAGPLACTGAPVFGGSRWVNGGDHPVALALGDLNRDGEPDIVTANQSEMVSVLLGQGDGTFAAKTDQFAGLGLASLALGDVDGDGTLDIVGGSVNASAVSVLLGKGDGTFASPRDYGTWDSLSASVALGDLNADGKLDAVVARDGAGVVSVLLGKGDGTFPTSADYPCGDHPRGMVLADLNGDDRLDVLVANNYRGTVNVLVGQGDGTLAPRLESSSVGANLDSVPPALGDLNGDGTPDLVVADQSRPSVLLGKGDGQFLAPLDLGLDFMGGPISLALRDINGDGKLDLAGAFTGTFSVWFGKGGMTFGSRVDSPTDWYDLFGMADLNGDGQLDLATILYRAGSDGSLGVLLGNGNGTFGPGRYYATKNYPLSVALGDLDGDGKLDIVAAGRYVEESTAIHTVDVLLGSGDGGFGAAAEYPTGNSPVAVAVADLDGDRRMDVVTANQREELLDNCNASTVSALLGKGDGRLAAKVDYEVACGAKAIALGDLNADGKLDVATVGSKPYSPGTATVLLGAGGGKLAGRADYPVGVDPDSLALGDVNGDGRLDMVLPNAAAEPSVSVLLGKGDGTLAAKADYPSDPRDVPISIALADLNGDGHLDIVTGNWSSSVSVLLGKGDGTFPTHVDYPVLALSVAVGDVNGDGRLDIVTGFAAANVLFGAGDGTFPSWQDFLFIGTSFALGDVNGDGRLDLVAAAPSSSVAVLLNSCR